MLKTFHEGQLVTVGDQPGVVAHVPSLVKVEVAIEDSEGGAVFRSLHPKAITPREESGPADETLRRLIRRGAIPGRSGSAGGGGNGGRGHSRPAGHRTTGK